MEFPCEGHLAYIYGARCPKYMSTIPMEGAKAAGVPRASMHARTVRRQRRRVQVANMVRE
jgi:hypothetical protein